MELSENWFWDCYLMLIMHQMADNVDNWYRGYADLTLEYLIPFYKEKNLIVMEIIL